MSLFLRAAQSIFLYRSLQSSGHAKIAAAFSLLKPTISKRSLFIQVEDTPNEHALKFVPGCPVTRSLEPTDQYYNQTIEFTSPDAPITHRSKLAMALFSVSGTESIMFGPEFISICKKLDASWSHMKPGIFAAIMDHFQTAESSTRPPLLEHHQSASAREPRSDKSNPLEAAIIEILDSRIRPVVQADGGDVEYLGMTEAGWVQLRLQGSCRSCSSSTVTLRNGIESMLMYYIPEIKGVEQIE